MSDATDEAPLTEAADAGTSADGAGETVVTSSGGAIAGVWRLVDPKISLASVASMLLGACAAAAVGPIQWGWLALTVAGILAIEAAKNASGEVFDWYSGVDRAVAETDRSPFSGGKRVIVDGLLTPGQTWVVAILGYAVGIGAGVVIVIAREPAILWLGIAGVAVAFFYHAPPFKFAYRGLGELAVAAAYGPGIAAGTYLVQRGEVPPWLIALSIPLGLLIGAFLWINEFPDAHADRQSGKKTLVVHLGKRPASVVFAVLIALSFAGLVALPLFMDLTWFVCLAAIAALPAALATRALLRTPDETPELVPAQAKTLLSFLLYAVGASAGLLIATAL